MIYPDGLILKIHDQLGFIIPKGFRQAAGGSRDANEVVSPKDLELSRTFWRIFGYLLLVFVDSWVVYIYIYNYIYILPNCACWVIFCQRFDVLPPDFSSKKIMQSEIGRIYSPYWRFTENCNLMRLSIAWFEQYHMSPIQTGCSLSLALLIHIFCS